MQPYGRQPASLMTEAAYTEEAELLEHRSYQIRLIQNDPEFISAVALPTQRPVLIMAPDRSAVAAETKLPS